jgi:hypothetical protein
MHGGCAPLHVVPDQVENDEDYITVTEGAAIPKWSKAKLYRLIKADPTVPALIIGATVRLPKQRYLRWLRQHEQGQATRKGHVGGAR